MGKPRKLRTTKRIGGQIYEIENDIAEHVKNKHKNLEQKGEQVGSRPEKYKGASR